MIQGAECERLENGAIVFSFNSIGCHLFGLKAVARTCFVVENGGVKFLFSLECPKDHCFRHAGRLRDLFRGCASKPLLGKKPHGNCEYLQSPLFPIHTGSTRCALNRHLFTQLLSSVPLHPADKVSTYLPS